MEKKVCFSYIRFSSEGQWDGSSIARQSPIAQRVANQKGWIPLLPSPRAKWILLNPLAQPPPKSTKLEGLPSGELEKCLCYFPAAFLSAQRFFAAACIFAIVAGDTLLCRFLLNALLYCSQKCVL